MPRWRSLPTTCAATSRTSRSRARPDTIALPRREVRATPSRAASPPAAALPSCVVGPRRRSTPCSSPRERDRATARGREGQRRSATCSTGAVDRAPIRIARRTRRSRRCATCSTPARNASERDLGRPARLQAEMFAVIGRTYERMGLRDKALPLLETRRSRSGASDLGPEHVAVAQSLNNLGVLQREQGDLAAARAAAGGEPGDAAPAARARSTRTWRSRWWNWRGCSQDRGRSDEAEPLISRGARHPPAGVRRRASRDRDEQERAGPWLLLRRGDLAGAETLLRENVATTERTARPRPSEYRDREIEPGGGPGREGGRGRRRAAAARGARRPPSRARDRPSRVTRRR